MSVLDPLDPLAAGEAVKVVADSAPLTLPPIVKLPAVLVITVAKTSLSAVQAVALLTYDGIVGIPIAVQVVGQTAWQVITGFPSFLLHLPQLLRDLPSGAAAVVFDLAAFTHDRVWTPVAAAAATVAAAAAAAVRLGAGYAGVAWRSVTGAAGEVPADVKLCNDFFIYLFTGREPAVLQELRDQNELLQAVVMAVVAVDALPPLLHITLALFVLGTFFEMVFIWIPLLIKALVRRMLGWQEEPAGLLGGAPEARRLVVMGAAAPAALPGPSRRSGKKGRGRGKSEEGERVVVSGPLTLAEVQAELDRAGNVVLRLSGRTVEGKGDLVLRRPNTLVCDASLAITGSVRIAAPGCGLESVRVTRDAHASPAVVVREGPATLQGVAVRGGKGAAVVIEGPLDDRQSLRVAIDSLEARGCGGGGVAARGACAVTVQGSTVADCGGMGVLADGASTEVGLAACAISNSATAGVRATAGANCYVRETTVEGGGAGLQARGRDTSLEAVQCRVAGCAGAAVAAGDRALAMVFASHVAGARGPVVVSEGEGTLVEMTEGSEGAEGGSVAAQAGNAVVAKSGGRVKLSRVVLSAPGGVPAVAEGPGSEVDLTDCCVAKGGGGEVEALGKGRVVVTRDKPLATLGDNGAMGGGEGAGAEGEGGEGEGGPGEAQGSGGGEEAAATKGGEPAPRSAEPESAMFPMSPPAAARVRAVGEAAEGDAEEGRGSGDSSNDTPPSTSGGGGGGGSGGASAGGEGKRKARRSKRTH